MKGMPEVFEMVNKLDSAVSSSNSVAEPRIRKDFIETWIFDNFNKYEIMQYIIFLISKYSM